MQVIDVFDHPSFVGTGNAQIVDHRQMLNVFTQPHASGMRTHRQVVFSRHQHHRQHFIDAPQATGVDLNYVNRFTHDELLEHNAVLAHLAGGNLDRMNPFANATVSFDIIRAGGLFDKPGLGECQMFNPRDGVVDLPDLVGVDHQLTIGADDLASNAHAADIVFQISPHLQLQVGETGIDRFLTQPTQLVVRVAQPPGGGGVTGVAFLQQPFQTLLFTLRPLFEQRERLLRRNAVGDVAKIDAAHQFLWRHLRHQPPHRLPLGFGPQIPNRVDHRAGRQVDRPLVRPDPTQLAVAGKTTPKGPHIGGDLFQSDTDDLVLQRADRRAADLIAAANGKSQPVAAQIGAIGLQDHISGGVVGIRIHRIGSVQRQ
ncbi:hypothetical protein D3C72_1217820 [compost metagenome]